MGDLLYEGHGSRGRDLFFAAQMYTQAALKGNPQVCSWLGLLFISNLSLNLNHKHLPKSYFFLYLQGWYSLGLLAEDVYGLPLSILSKLGLSKLYMADNSLLQTALFQRWESISLVSVLQMILVINYVWNKGIISFLKVQRLRHCRFISALQPGPLQSVFTVVPKGVQWFF